MIGLDTPLLLELLRAGAGSKALARRLENEEVCTTAMNLFELETLARLDMSSGRDLRLAGLGRLRRKLTILPIDDRSVTIAAAYAAKDGTRSVPVASWNILGALEANGCSEWFTIAAARFPKVSRTVKVSYLGKYATM